MKQPALILGSSSPRRKELLSVVGLNYEVIKPETEELHRPGEPALDYVRRNAREKCEWVAAHLQSRAARYPHGAIVICADTIVVLSGSILEKPRDHAHAKEMLRALSGNAHTVYTGVELRSVLNGRDHTAGFVTATTVRIKPLTDNEIEAYIRTGEPLDKAGGYAAQGIGSYMVERIEGSYTNVVGLPVAELVRCLEQEFNFSLWNSQGKAPS